MEELNKLIDELVVKRGPYTGYIKKDQDPVKVARLLELGYNEPIKERKEDVEDRLERIENTLAKIKKTLAEHSKKIADIGVRR